MSGGELTVRVIEVTDGGAIANKGGNGEKTFAAGYLHDPRSSCDSSGAPVSTDAGLEVGGSREGG